MMVLLLLMTLLVSTVIGQQLGVSLKLGGVTIPSDSLVDVDDIMYTAPNTQCCSEPPSNTNPRDEALLCVTDLVDCCESPRTVRGDWYYPDGRIVEYNPPSSAAFQANRGPHEEVNGQQFYGTVRLFRRYSALERGRFHCELPRAADPSINQTIYANIVNFGFTYAIDPVTISTSGASTAGETYSLMCSVTLFDPIPLPSNVPSPTFQWFFNSSASLPSGLTPMVTAVSSRNSTSETYTSTLQFSPLNQSHSGMYTCQLGAASLVNSNMFAVNAPPITVMVTANLNTPLIVGQIGNTLTCDTSGTDSLSPAIAYQWTRNDGSTQTQVGSSKTLTLPSLTLSGAGEYSCSATVGSALLTSDIEASAVTPQRVEIQVPDPQSVIVTSSGDSIVRNGSTVTVICTVELGPAILPSEVPLLLVSAWLFKNGAPLTVTALTMTGTTYNFGTMVSSFSERDIGNYTCTATISPQPSSTFLTGMGYGESNNVEIVIGIPPIAGPDGNALSGDSSNTRCTKEIAITVVATILIECLLAALIIAAGLALHWKRSQRPQSCDKRDAMQDGEINLREGVYEEPDIHMTAYYNTNVLGNFMLTECPAYVATT